MPTGTPGIPLFTRLFLILFGTVFFIAGTLAATTTAKRHLHNRNLAGSGVHTHGNIVDYKISNSGKSGSIRAVVTFTASDERQITFTSKAQLRYSGYSMGASVPVVYDSNNPHDAEINEPERLYSGRIAYVVGPVFMFFGAGICFWGGFGASRSGRKADAGCGK